MNGDGLAPPKEQRGLLGMSGMLAGMLGPVLGQQLGVLVEEGARMMAADAARKDQLLRVVQELSNNVARVADLLAGMRPLVKLPAAKPAKKGKTK